MGKDPDSKIQKSKKSKNYRCAPKSFGFFGFTLCFLVFFCVFPKKPMVFLDFQGFCFWKILKIQKKTYCFFGFFRLFLKNHKKKQGFFWILNGVTRKIQRKTMVFFGCSRFLLLEKFENPKKPIVFFGFFRLFLKNPKRHKFFFGF